MVVACHHMLRAQIKEGRDRSPVIRLNEGCVGCVGRWHQRRWVGTKIPDIDYIDHLFFLTPEVGWISGADGKTFLYFELSTAAGTGKSPELLLLEKLPRLSGSR